MLELLRDALHLRQLEHLQRLAHELLRRLGVDDLALGDSDVHQAGTVWARRATATAFIAAAPAIEIVSSRSLGPAAAPATKMPGTDVLTVSNGVLDRRDEAVLLLRHAEDRADLFRAPRRLHAHRQHDHVHRHLHRAAHGGVLALDQQPAVLLDDLGHDPAHEVDAVLLLGLPVDPVLPEPVHAHVDVEDEDLAVGHQLADLDRFLRGDPATDLGAVLVTDPAIAGAHALDETHGLRRLSR